MSDDRPKRLFDVDGIARAPVRRPSHEDCPGALLLVNRSEYDEYARGGEIFVTHRKDIPEAGRGSARVLCKGQVMSKASELGGMVYYGLCASCSGLEARHRAGLAAIKRGRREAAE